MKIWCALAMTTMTVVSAHADVGVFSPDGTVTAVSYHKDTDQVSIQRCVPTMDINSAAECVAARGASALSITVSNSMFSSVIKDANLRKREKLLAEIHTLESAGDSAEAGAKKAEIADLQKKLAYAKQFGTQAQVDGLTSQISVADQQLVGLTANSRAQLEADQKTINDTDADLAAFQALEGKVLAEAFTKVSVRSDPTSYTTLMNAFPTLRVGSLSKRQIMTALFGSSGLTLQTQLTYGRCNLQATANALLCNVAYNRDGSQQNYGKNASLPANRVANMADYSNAVDDFMSAVKHGQCL